HMSQNPYTLTFGKKPSQLVSRTTYISSIFETFNSPAPTQQVFIITGVRGSGKTVLMTEATKQFKETKDWIVVELNPERDLLISLAAKLSSIPSLVPLFKDAKINLSFFGLSLEIKSAPPITDIEIALQKMIEVLNKKKKRLLITIDEVSNTKEMKVFASTFQILIRQELPVFLLMTGLYDNVDALQNEKTMTFLYRAPKINLSPLRISSIAENYQTIFKLSDEEALEMARLTNGYPFAFQVLGYFRYQNGDLGKKTLHDFQQYLQDYAYDKIWMELSKKDKDIAYGIATTHSKKISDIRKTLNIQTNQFNPYRNRLIKKGIINGDTYGYVSFTLPLFDKYIKENYFD
ncbi:MAG: ATP-binding protein, partial [Solobacterium sp.]|nr:ATP-binding protein [Solobacterium sp.]